jgi:prepilin-type N-terminal cleavage/methylation domain-containing protein
MDRVDPKDFVTMITNPAPIRPSPTGLPSQSEGRSPRHRRCISSEGGFTLIEVVIASLLVGIVTLATFTGFDVLGRYDASQRHHDEATVIAAQAEESLRSDPALALDELANASAHSHVYTQTVQGTKYTVTQSAEFETGSNTTPVCGTSSGGSAEASNYVRTSAYVTWNGAPKGRGVTETSIITPPVGSALEVDVTNGAKTEAPVPGVTVIADGIEATTNENGCVIYNGIPATTTELEVYRYGYVTKGGAHDYVSKSISIAPNVITHVPVTLAPGGYITATFRYKGGTLWTHKNNAGSNISETVTGDTFVAQNNELGAPELIAGSTGFLFNAASNYTTVPGTYKATASTPIESAHYPTGDLFPLQSAWTDYAGDCSLNNPTKYGEAVEPGATVIGGTGSSVYVPMSYVTLNVYKGVKTTEGFTPTPELPVKITNLSCTVPLAPTPNDAYQANYEHHNTTNAEAHLTAPFQPFGKFKLCLWNKTLAKTYTSTYTNSTAKGSEVNIFLEHAAGTYEEGTGSALIETTVAVGQATNTC